VHCELSSNSSSCNMELAAAAQHKKTVTAVTVRAVTVRAVTVRAVTVRAVTVRAVTVTAVTVTAVTVTAVTVTVVSAQLHFRDLRYFIKKCSDSGEPPCRCVALWRRAFTVAKSQLSAGGLPSHRTSRRRGRLVLLCLHNAGVAGAPKIELAVHRAGAV
jgi:hypothetical protein